MDNRLPIDANIIGYWGFDEANGTDPAIDESSNAITLTVNGSALAIQSRIGNARQFDGSTVYASPSSSTLLQLDSNLTIICWINIYDLNNGGSLLRTVLACDGPTTGSADNSQYNISVDNTGALIFKHEHGSGVQVVWKTAADTIGINRFYSVAIQRSISAGVATVTLYLNNSVVSWASITDGGTPTVTPSAPSGGSTATFFIGKSNKASDSAYWDGLIDEVSVHNTQRTYQPYLISAYFQVALQVTSTRFTAYNDVKSVGSFEMGGGNRWWVYERDQNLFVVRENSLGYFSAEVQLTTSNNTAFGAPTPAEAAQPEVYYDVASDVLLVAFLSGGKIYKITATAEDAPSTQIMPLTADTSGIIKLEDSTEASRFGGGGSPIGILGTIQNDGGTMTEETPISAPIQFIGVPSFGVAVNNDNPYGYALFQVRGGAAQLVATVTVPYFGNGFNGTYYFFSIPTRVFGTQYFVRPIRRNGSLGSNASNLIIDWLGQVVPLTPESLVALKANSDGGDIPDFGTLGAGQADSKALQYLVTYVGHTPIKLLINEGPDDLGAGGADHLQIGSSTRTTITT
jgi:hypothetical protein